MQKGLEPLDEIESMVQELEARSNEKSDYSLLIAGHLPYLAKLAARLLCGNENLIFLDFGTVTIASFEKSFRTNWILKWMLCPDII